MDWQIVALGVLTVGLAVFLAAFGRSLWMTRGEREFHRLNAAEEKKARA